MLNFRFENESEYLIDIIGGGDQLTKQIVWNMRQNAIICLGKSKCKLFL